jgi:hypothetical protein
MGFKQIQALYPAGTKFNIIGHSQGGLYTRDAITNLGIAPYVASLTTVDSPHRGSFINSVQTSITAIFPWFADIVHLGMPWHMDPDHIAAFNRNISDLTVEYMTKVFNPNTPDLMIKKYNGKSQPCMVTLVCQNKNNPKGDLPWIKITNLISAVNTFTWAWMSIRRVGV